MRTNFAVKIARMLANSSQEHSTLRYKVAATNNSFQELHMLPLVKARDKSTARFHSL